MQIVENGLVISQPDVTTSAELDEFLGAVRANFGTDVEAFRFWAEFRPDVLKRFRMQIHETSAPEITGTNLLHALAFLHHYAVVGFQQGIEYQLRAAQRQGASRDDVLDCLALAFLESGPRGVHFVAAAASDILRVSRLGPPAEGQKWPAGWQNDPQRSTQDSTSRLQTSRPTRFGPCLTGTSGLWRSSGFCQVARCQAPPNAQGLLVKTPVRVRPGGLPKEIVPYLMIHLNVGLGRVEGVRRGLFLARGFGLTRADRRRRHMGIALRRPGRGGGCS